jgi:hypothetical protein
VEQDYTHATARRQQFVLEGAPSRGRHCHSTPSLPAILSMDCHFFGIYMKLLLSLLPFSVTMTASPRARRGGGCARDAAARRRRTRPRGPRRPPPGTAPGRAHHHPSPPPPHLATTSATARVIDIGVLFGGVPIGTLFNRLPWVGRAVLTRPPLSPPARAELAGLARGRDRRRGTVLQ